jgi:hypothetical protein
MLDLNEKREILNVYGFVELMPRHKYMVYLIVNYGIC